MVVPNIDLMSSLHRLHAPTILLLFVLLWQSAQGQQSELERRLFDLPDVSFVRMEQSDHFQEVYELRIRQPLDHAHPEAGHFYQRVFLAHSGFDAVTVIATEGYSREYNRVYEPTRILKANQVDVEHRFFGVSRPDSLDYRYLTLEQATADLHHIRTLLGQLYDGHWVSTGISKGGQTTIYYRYFYPDDVRVSIPYVAPHNLSLEDPRIYEFLNSVGSADCRKKILDFQLRVLKSRDDLLPKLRWYAVGRGMNFSYLTLEEAFEFAVLEYPFSFWQWGAQCGDIPGPKADLDVVLKHLLAVSDISFYEDKTMDGYASHYYQAASQMGYYGYETAPFKRYLKVLPVSPHPNATFPPGKQRPPYDPTLSHQVAEWLSQQGDRFIYIYGELDTWSATAVPETEGRDALWFFLKGAHHGTARIRNMEPQERDQLNRALEKWLNLELKD